MTITSQWMCEESISLVASNDGVKFTKIFEKIYPSRIIQRTETINSIAAYKYIRYIALKVFNSYYWFEINDIKYVGCKKEGLNCDFTCSTCSGTLKS